MMARFAVPMLVLLAVVAWGTAELVETVALSWSDETVDALGLAGAGADELAAAEAAGAERAAWLHRATLVLFAAQAALTLGLLVLARAWLWRRWTRRVRDLMDGHEPADRYAPVLRELRDRVDRMARERPGTAAADGDGQDAAAAG